MTQSEQIEAEMSQLKAMCDSFIAHGISIEGQFKRGQAVLNILYLAQSQIKVEAQRFAISSLE